MDGTVAIYICGLFDQGSFSLFVIPTRGKFGGNHLGVTTLISTSRRAWTLNANVQSLVCKINKD